MQPPPAAHAATLRVRLRPSQRFGWLLLVGHAAALLLSWAGPLAWWLSLALSAGVLTSLSFNLRYHAWRSARRALTGLELRADGSAAVEDREGRWTEIRILGSSFVSPVLAILNLAVAEARLRRALIVAPDTLSAEEFRRLRVWLRWRNVPADLAGANNHADT